MIILTPSFTPQPEPPQPPVIPAALRRRLPVAVVPEWYSIADVERRIAGQYQPVFIGKVTRLKMYDLETLVIGKLHAMDARKQQRRIA